MVFKKAEILIPKDADMTKWGTVACDQYTSEPQYWDRVSDFTCDSVSAYKLILPEVYLENDDVDEKIKEINQNMKKYIAEDVFKSLGECYVYVERTLKNGAVRKGIVGAIDLEEYDYSKGSTTRVRATEKTVVERIPPRLKVRRDAELELPHIMILIDNPEKDIIEKLEKQKKSFEKIYDFDLMMDSGHITGYVLNDSAAQELENNLSSLDDIEKFNKKYLLNDKTPLIYAMGDGNHSLATAKEYYRQVKEGIIPGNAELARYALCEIVNLHDDSLEFEAIHRVLFELDSDDFVSELEKFAHKGCDGQSFVLVHNGNKTSYSVNNPTANITIGSVQNFLDEYLSSRKGKIDYIHGETVVEELSHGNNFGIIFDSMDKSDLFKTVAVDGALPRKTFSMGEACDKRFYVESRKIK